MSESANEAELVPYQLKPGNRIAGTWVNWRGRTCYAKGVIMGVRDGAVLVAASADTPEGRWRAIDYTRFRAVDVEAEGDSAKALRAEKAKQLGGAAKMVKLQTFDPNELLDLIEDIRRSFSVQ